MSEWDDFRDTIGNSGMETSMVKRPIDLGKYPLVGRCYDLVREIEALPASGEAIGLVERAEGLMDDLWNYLETHSPKACLGDLIREALEKKYKGKKIKNLFIGVTFIVDHVEVKPDGPDPQMNILLASRGYYESVKAWQEWDLKYNLMGGQTPPPEIRDSWEAVKNEFVILSQVDDVLPEIVE